MTDESGERSTKSTSSGEGERQAQRGYVPQYDIGARLIYEHLADGRLEWIGLADRGAGGFDDLVLGLRDRISAYQIKTRQDPQQFSVRTLLLGSQHLLRTLVEAWRKLTTDFPNAIIETNYACDDNPRTNDNLVGNGRSLSSAAFLRTHEKHRLSWGITEWHSSQYGTLIDEIQKESGLDETSFELMWRHTRFLCSSHGRSVGLGGYSVPDARRLHDLAGLLPRLVADPSGRDRWSVGDLLTLLGWRSPFSLRHGHTFPVDAFYQTNRDTEDKLQQVLSSTSSGYVSLIGPPGGGKSTLLAAGLLPTPRATIVRYLAFVPNEGHGLGRAEAVHFLQDLITQLKQQGLGAGLMTGSEVDELQTQFETLLREANSRYQREQVRTVFVIDGLDHVPREEKPKTPFLSVLPLPHSLPDGIIFVLGTQKLDLDGMPPSVRDSANHDDRKVVVTPLPREAVNRWADAAGIANDVDRSELYARVAGHPLSTRYVIGGLLNARTPADRKHWLQNAPAYGGDVNEFYQRAWRDLEKDADAKQALAYLALAEGAVSPTSLDILVGAGATDLAWSVAGHLMLRDHRDAWSIFHNSFRLFLRERTALRHGLPDEDRIRRRYRDLAEMAQSAAQNDPQRWMELRYRARADDHDAVLALATPHRFRAQFVEGRNPSDIRDDINFAFRSVGVLRKPNSLVELILSKHEINLRCDALGDDVFEALVGLGELRAAMGILDAASSLTAGKAFELVDALLEGGQVTEARALFQRLEPIEKLLGSKTLEPFGRDSEVVEWARRALAFHPPRYFLAALNHLRAPDNELNSTNIDTFCESLKLTAVRGQLMRDASLDIDALVGSLQIEDEYRSVVLRDAVIAAFESEDDELAITRFQTLLPLTTRLELWDRRDLAMMAARVGRLDIAAQFYDGVPPPTLGERESDFSDKELTLAGRQVFLHVALGTWLGTIVTAGEVPRSPLLATLQLRLQSLGALLGQARANQTPHPQPVEEFRDTLDFIQRAKGDNPHDDWRFHRMLTEIVVVMVDIAAAFGSDSLARLTEDVDSRLANSPGRLGGAAVRRAYAVAVFRHENDAVKAENRLSYQPGLQPTPEEDLAEAALAALALANFGLKDRGKSLLSSMHIQGLGYSRPAKKDPQYVVWQDIFARACHEDPLGRPARLKFFARLLHGMANTEGRNAGYRIVGTVLEQAAQADFRTSCAITDHLEEAGLLRWTDLVAGLVVGAAKRNIELCASASVIFGRLALPFMGDDAHDTYSKLIEIAPSAQVENIVRHGVVATEADSHPDHRILSLEKIVKASAARQFEVGSAELTRWRAELPHPKSGESPEDPFFLVRSLAQFTIVLKQSGKVDDWRACRSFEKLVAEADYDEAKSIFDGSTVLQNAEGCIEAIAYSAISVGRRDDAVFCLARLKEAAESRGGWGDSWFGNYKQRYYALGSQIHGESWREAAFDALVIDLASGKQSIYAVLIGLADLLGTLSPQPTWADVWSSLQAHLTQFREYKTGRDLTVPSTVLGADQAEHTLADILFRAIETTATELAEMTRSAAFELTRTPGGSAIVAALIQKLWQAGENYALAATHIAWQCRHDAELRESLRPLLQEMINSDDYAVGLTGMRLAGDWQVLYSPKRAELPAFYKLTLVPNEQAAHFAPPSGSSLTASGLYTDDPYAWTWPLEQALKWADKACAFDLPRLRARAAQLMSRMGGPTLFGPDAVNRQERRMKRLDVRLTYQKLLPTAAFRAMREVIGELVAANAIDLDAIPYILPQTAAFAFNAPPIAPLPRPIGVRQAQVRDVHSRDATAWRGDVLEDVVFPTMEGRFVLAYAAVHESRNFKEVSIVEQYRGPNCGLAKDGLSSQLWKLPRILIFDDFYPLYKGPAEGAVVHPVRDIACSVPSHSIMLCPVVAARLGWRLDQTNAFRYIDDRGDTVVETTFWRDGGVLTDDHDPTGRAFGQLLTVREDCLEDLRPFLDASYVGKAWRATETRGHDDRVVSCAERTQH